MMHKLCSFTPNLISPSDNIWHLVIRARKDFEKLKKNLQSQISNCPGCEASLVRFQEPGPQTRGKIKDQKAEKCSHWNKKLKTSIRYIVTNVL